MSETDSVDRKLLNRLQDDLPLCAHPFSAVADELGMTESDVIARIQAMKQQGIITRFGPFFDAEAMGGAFCLCAMAVPDARFAEVTEMVNTHDEVAHNYARSHALNMWFVLATEDKAQIDAVADAIEAETGLRVLRFPKLREFFIGFRVAA